MKGFFSLVLHYHLPFIKHPEYDYFYEENWLFEAVIESYVPLLMKLYALENEGVKFKLTCSLSPPLCEMLRDTELKEKLKNYVERLITLARKEESRLKNNPKFLKLAQFYGDRFKGIKDFIEKELNWDILEGYRRLKEKGAIEITTCGATHGLLPALRTVPEAVITQVRVAVKNFKKHFGFEPKGIWLPECGYYPEVEKILREFGIKFFFLDSHGLLYGKPFPKYGVYAPVETQEGLFAFAREPESSKQVWSAKEGYPGDPWYREFYRDIGFDLPIEEVKNFINPDGTRTYTGIKYYRITGNVSLGEKEPYEPSKALERAREHADHYHFCLDKRIDYVKGIINRKPLIVAPFDAELFGHWWFEGNDFIYYLMRNFNKYKVIEATTPSEYLEKEKDFPKSQPAVSSWGDKGYFDVWVNAKNDWIYPYLHDMALILNGIKRGKQFKGKERILNQMLRELLLAQSSDWSFLITTGTAGNYPIRRLKEHISNFYKLKEMLEGKVNEEFLGKLERKNSIFQEIDFWKDWG